MATNFDKFKQMLEKRAEATATTSSKSRWLKLEKGQTKTVRFLPLKSQNLELPIEIFDHHAVTFPDGKYASFACKKKKGEGECPFCKLASEMWQKYSATKDEKFKDAFKQLVVKTAYLLVGYDVNTVDTSNITEEDIFIVRASAKDAIAKMDSFLQKGKDFVDFTTGRNCDLTKPTADKQAILWTWDDPEPAFTGKNGQAIWDKLVEVSPDLSEEVASPSDERLAELLAQFKATPVDSGSSHMEDIPEAPAVQNRLPASSKPVSKSVAKDDSDSVDLDALRKALED